MGKRRRQPTENWIEKAKGAAAADADAGNADADAGNASEELEDDELEGTGPTSLLERLMRDFSLEREAAVFLLGYALTRQDEEEPSNRDPLLLARLLRTQPWVWSAVRDTDYVRFTHALTICGLPTLDAKVLQKAVGDAEHALDDGRQALRAGDAPDVRAAG